MEDTVGTVKMMRVKTMGTSEVRNDQGSPHVRIKAKPTTRDSHARIENGILESIAYIRNAGGHVL